MGGISQKKLNISKSVIDRKEKNTPHHVLKKLNFFFFLLGESEALRKEYKL